MAAYARPVRHLVVRFFRSLRPITPAAADERWARGYLTDAEWELFATQPVVDRAHGLGGARMVAADLGDDRDAIEAALVHDVAKRHAGLGVFGRSVATAAGWLLRSGDARRRWAESPGRRGRIGSYLRHDEVGAAEIATAGGSALAVRWARAHHHRDRCQGLSCEPEVSTALARADHDT